MKTLFANLAHGNEPYILAATIGSALGDTIIPLLYPEKQESILKRWIGNSENIYLDEGSGRILSRITFRGNYRDYFGRVLTNGKNVVSDLSDYLRDFEAVSLAGKRKRFSRPDIELNVGFPIILPNIKSFYIFPGPISEYARSSPVNVEELDEFVELAKEAEAKHEIIFIPAVNSFSYKNRKPVEREVSTPPLKRKGSHESPIEKGIFATLPGSLVLENELKETVEKSKMKIYHLPQDNLPGEVVNTHEIIFNPNIVAVLARAGWGTLWMCQAAEKPIIAPAWKPTDDPEIYHNNKTVEALGLGVVYEKFSEDIIRDAATKTGKIKSLNKQLFKTFGTLDGITFVQEKIKERL